jgi:ADP-ribosylglycohydrolase
MLVELAIADAYGAGLEYVKDDFLKENHTMDKYTKHPTHNLPAGKYTDDTQMSIAVAEAIISCDGKMTNDLDEMVDLFARHFVGAFKRDWRNGYARGFQKFLAEIKDHKEFLAKIKPTSDKSGGAMRAAPCGLFADIAEVKRVSRLQASITHNTADGMVAAEAAALMAHYFYYDLGPIEDLGVFLNQVVTLSDHDWDETWKERIKSKGWMSVRAAITGIVMNDDTHNILRDICWMGGDVDTAAAIAIGAAACSPRIVQNIPDILYWNLENGPYGREYLHKLDNKLTEIFPR